MTTQTSSSAMQTADMRQERLIEAPIEVTFESLLAQLGPEGQMPDGTPFPMKIEAWPGGRWYRDLGNNAGHWWGHVQVIKPPALLELCGPMFMSYPAVSHVQYRLTAEGSGTRLSVRHRAMGLIPPDHLEGMGEGWEHALRRVGQIAAARLARRG